MRDILAHTPGFTTAELSAAPPNSSGNSDAKGHSLPLSRRVRATITGITVDTEVVDYRESFVVSSVLSRSKSGVPTVRLWYRLKRTRPFTKPARATRPQRLRTRRSRGSQTLSPYSTILLSRSVTHLKSTISRFSDCPLCMFISLVVPLLSDAMRCSSRALGYSSCTKVSPTIQNKTEPPNCGVLSVTKSGAARTVPWKTPCTQARCLFCQHSDSDCIVRLMRSIYI